VRISVTPVLLYPELSIREATNSSPCGSEKVGIV
jgi:hypothetical protein